MRRFVARFNFSCTFIEIARNPILAIPPTGNLPDELKIPGLKIVVRIGNPSDHEFAACTTMGPSLNWVELQQQNQNRTFSNKK